LECCAACGECRYRYHSCRNRHCPQCQAKARAAWLLREAGWLLPVEYHHLVFTLPDTLNPLALSHPRLVYGLLFAAARAAVLELAADPKYLGAQVGLVAVLHTWGQTLSLHPHLHVLASGGGLSCNRRGEIDAQPCWRSCRPGFFLPVRLLGALFRGKFLAGLRQAPARGQLPGLSPEAWAALLSGLYKQSWVVYSQPPCAGAEVVLKYLARYVHRVAISNSRLVAASDTAVTFTCKDYRQRGKEKQLTLALGEFVRRLLQHVLPRGLVRVRHYGLLANRGREGKLQTCRRLLLAAGVTLPVSAVSAAVPAGPVPGSCPACGVGVLVVVALLPRPRGGEGSPAVVAEDSS
jgi:Putative transposase/Transposase zinc-binding domain